MLRIFRFAEQPDFDEKIDGGKCEMRSASTGEQEWRAGAR